METKRKAAQAASASPGVDDRATKRRKLPATDPSSNETPEATYDHGIQFLELVKQAKDKRGRLIATNFLTLPDKKQFPDYYEAIVMPLALDTIEAKLNRREYPNLTTLESDVKRLVANAKGYNEKTSELFADAERIRKMVSLFMSKHNPAYKDPKYTAFPTPLPNEAVGNDGEGDKAAAPEVTSADSKAKGSAVDGDGDVEMESAVGRGGMRSTRKNSSARAGPAKSVNGKAKSATPVAEDHSSDFAGQTFQTAQEQIVTEMIKLKNEDGVDVSWPFLNLPARKLTDYYHLIKNPESLKRIEKKVRGIQGRDDPTGISMFKSWQAFEEHVSLIWRNAREYNEDGSEISILADRLESFFQKRIAGAKKVVTEPAQPSLKLKMSAAKSPDPPTQKIMLRVGGGAAAPPKPPNPGPVSSRKGSDSTNAPTTPGVAIDDGALQRQQQHVQAGVDRQVNRVADANPAPAQPTVGAQTESASTSVATAVNPPANGDQVAAVSVKSPTPAAVKAEAPTGRSSSTGSAGAEPPRLNGTHPIPIGTSMPPPSVTSSVVVNGTHPPAAPSQQPYVPPPPPLTPFDSKLRLPGKTDALISNLSVSTHPMLRIGRPFRLEIPPSAKVTQQSITVNLPSNHTYLRIIPTMSSNVSTRQSKIFITATGQRLNPLPPIPNHSDPNKPMYDVRLMPGVNRIEVEMIAGPLRGTPKMGSGPDVDLEKISLFVNLLRA